MINLLRDTNNPGTEQQRLQTRVIALLSLNKFWQDIKYPQNSM